jgi:hypothetical protein
MLSSAVCNRRSFHRGKTIVVSCFVVLLLIAAVPTAADPIISVIPASTNVSQGDSFSIDILISGAIDLYAFQLGILFEPTILAASNPIQGTILLGAGTTIPFDTSFVFIDNVFGEILHLDSLVGPISGAQGDGTVLTLTFEALAVGMSAISVGQVQGLPTELLDSATPFPSLIPFTVRDAVVTVSPTAVPEPSTLLLLLSGMAVSAVGRRRSRRSSAARP